MFIVVTGAYNLLRIPSASDVRHNVIGWPPLDSRLMRTTRSDRVISITGHDNAL